MRVIYFAIGPIVVLVITLVMGSMPGESPAGAQRSGLARGAIASVQASGTVLCNLPHSCEAYVTVAREGTREPIQHVLIPSTRTYDPRGIAIEMTAGTFRLPQPLAPGLYLISGTRADISDYVPPGGQTPTGDRFNESTLCSTGVKVGRSTTHIYVTLAFSDITCTITVTNDPLPPYPSATPTRAHLTPPPTPTPSPTPMAAETTAPDH